MTLDGGTMTPFRHAEMPPSSAEPLMRSQSLKVATYDTSMNARCCRYPFTNQEMSVIL